MRGRGNARIPQYLVRRLCRVTQNLVPDRPVFAGLGGGDAPLKVEQLGAHPGRSLTARGAGLRALCRPEIRAGNPSRI